VSDAPARTRASGGGYAGERRHRAAGAAAEISPAVSEQAGTNEEENGSEGDPQNTGTPDAGGAEDSKADAPESGEDENAGNNADAAVSLRRR